MDYRDSLNRTIATFDLSAVQLSERSGISTYTISRFRRGHSRLNSESLYKITQALPSDARFYFLALVASGGHI